MSETRLCMNCGWVVNKNSKLCQHCQSDNIEVVDTDATFGDLSDIEKISKNPNFIKAMLELHKTDIIEYEMKMLQFRNQAQQQKNNDVVSQKRCPKCGCTDFTPLRKKWSLLTGFVTNKVEMVCNKCGTKVK